MTREHHEWEQGLREAEYLIENPSYENDLVVDPFLGFSTSAGAAKWLYRHFIGCDVDEHCVNETRRRLFEEIDIRGE